MRLIDELNHSLIGRRRFWETADGALIRVKDMTRSHLISTIARLEERARCWEDISDGPIYDYSREIEELDDWIDVMQKELERRGPAPQRVDPKTILDNLRKTIL